MNPILSSWRDSFQPRDRRPIYDWAYDNVILSPPLTRTGRFDVSTSRHFIPIFDALQDEHVREVNVLKPVRGGGTLIADIWIAWTRAIDPGPFMFLLQSEVIADDHFQKIVLPILRSVPAVSRMMEGLDRHKVTNRKIEFADNNHFHINGPSIGNLQTNAFRYIVQSEPWLYESGRIGDANGRVGDYLKQQRSKIFRESQGGPRERVELLSDEWANTYNAAAIHEWQVQCASCGAYQDAVFSGMRPDNSFWGVTWDREKLSNGDWNIAKACQSIRFECESCGHPMMDTTKTKDAWNRTGRYRLAGEENRKRKSFRWEAVIDYPWDELVELWLIACNAEHRGDFKPKLQFLQKRRAMFRDEASLLRGGLNFKRVDYEINSDWPEERARFATFDRQEEDVFWGTVRAWSGERTRRLWFGKVYGESAIKEKVEEYKVKPNRVGIDSGFQPKGDSGVYAMCCRHGWISLKGDKSQEFIHKLEKGRTVRRSYAPLSWGDPELGKIHAGRRYAPLVRFSKGAMNAKVQQLIDSGVWEEPKNDGSRIESEYQEQMSSRVRVVEQNRKTGATQIYWRETRNDHARDLANMQCCMAILAKILADPVNDVEPERKS